MRGGSALKQHSVQKLSQTTITDAIMYLDARFTQPEKLVYVAPYDDKRAVSGIKLNSYKKGFQKFALSTSGLITWPSALVDELESEVGAARSSVRPITLAILVFVSALSVFSYFLITLDLFWAVLLVVAPLGLVFIYGYVTILLRTTHLLGNNQMHDIKKSDSIQPKDTVGEILDLFQTEFPTPLRLYVVGDYSQLTYTGRTKTSDTLVRLKEAILYPKLTVEKEDSTGA